MLKIRCFFVGVFFINGFSYCSNRFDHYYKTSFLKQYSQVRTELKAQGFREIFFKTPDGLRLNGLFLSRPNATCNVIVCAGWLPGKKEKMATFFALLPSYCNILLFDARGHGKSEGPLFREVWRYGVNEYKDIIGGVSCLRQLNRLPIVICGICSGAFNATHAVLSLQEQGLLEWSRIKGLVFDSGWGSITTISKTVAIGNNEIPIVKFIKKFCRIHTLKNVRDSLVYKCLFVPVKVSIDIVHTLFVRPIVSQYEAVTNLFDKIGRIQIPLFFIHSCNDLHAHIDDAQYLASLVPYKKCWWIQDGSYHAWHHLKKKDLYKKKLTDFIDRIL